jgi:uncharacterized protein
MSEIILQAAQLVLEAVPLLSSISSNAARLNALTAKIITIEEQADDIHNRGVKALLSPIAKEMKKVVAGKMQLTLSSARSYTTIWKE